MDDLVPLCQRKLRLLLIGLGGGTVPAYLEQKCPKGALHIDSVEYNQHVIDAARSFFGLRAGPGDAVSAEREDGLVAVTQRVASKATGQYDAAIVDCFGSDDRVPAPCASPKLMAGLASLLRPGGLVFQNLDLEPPAPIVARYREAFGQQGAELIRIGMLGQHLIRAHAPTSADDTAI